jgi:anti-sigma B factor antagonist
MRSSGRSFYLYRLSPAVEKTLGLVQLLSFFEILKDESALATLGG